MLNLKEMPTGISGLDTLLAGGIASHSFTVLTGAPGSGTTTLAHQIMFALAGAQRRALYFTMPGEPLSKMLRFQQQYAFFDRALVGPAIRHVELDGDLCSQGVEGVFGRMHGEVQAFRPQLVFLDACKPLVHERRREHGMASLQLAAQLSHWPLTSFLIGDYGDGRQAESAILAIADGVIHLCQHMDQDAMVRQVRVLKMGGAEHLGGLHPFRITAAGLRVYPRLLAGGKVPACQRGAARISSGSGELDDMLGGGIPVGYSVLVNGPSGCGKTVLATSFLKAGALAGEHGIVASFDNRIAGAANSPLQTLIDNGKVSEVRLHAIDLSIEEVVTELADAVARSGAGRVVIDSLTALELLLAPRFRERFEPSLFRTLSTLQARGVTVMMVRSQPQLAGEMFSAACIDVDCIICMRYVEHGNKLVKLICCPKLRGSQHSNEIRTFHTVADGIEIGGVLE